MRILTPKLRLLLPNSSLLLRLTTTPDMIILATITTTTTITDTERARLLIPVMIRRMRTRMTERRLMLLASRTRILSWS